MTDDDFVHELKTTIAKVFADLEVILDSQIAGLAIAEGYRKEILCALQSPR